ncbi:39S ribosomal protein L35, mitochondrial [Anopheles marshallii]|uniref:39S ribosomal protein L35, mitochondrial n=1 Tax=Anopheles marshallii TaxID=1521116 RepID=UPI00237B31AE|nr:39S ribosomal protein L35, mitochondrial [Anopheles marshallii]
MLRSMASLAIRQVIQTRTFASRVQLPAVPVFTSHSGRNFSLFVRPNNDAVPFFRNTISRLPNNTCSMEPSTSLRLLDAMAISPVLQTQPSRTVIKFSLRKGKRKTVKAVVKRFKRLDWGGWIRTISGRHKKMWRKRASRKRRLRQHVLVNGTQATLLDKMVTKYWKRPRYYIDDPYAPYHTREEFVYTRRKPLK